MRAVRFYVSCPAAFSSTSSASSAGLEQQAQEQSDPCRTSTARARSQCSPPHTNSKLRIRVFPAGPSASARLQCSPPDSNSKFRIRLLDRSVPRRARTASRGSECSPPDLNHKESPKIYQIECQKECQNICQKVCQNRCQIDCQKECHNICQKECQIECQNKYAIYTSRWYARNYVRIVFQGGDHSKKDYFTITIHTINLE